MYLLLEKNETWPNQIRAESVTDKQDYVTQWARSKEQSYWPQEEFRSCCGDSKVTGKWQSVKARTCTCGRTESTRSTLTHVN